MAKNKVTQEARRQIRSFVRQQYTILNEVIKPRPRFVPLWLWSRAARIFIDTPKLREFMEEGVVPKSQR